MCLFIAVDKLDYETKIANQYRTQRVDIKRLVVDEEFIINKFDLSFIKILNPLIYLNGKHL